MKSAEARQFGHCSMVVALRDRNGDEMTCDIAYRNLQMNLSSCIHQIQRLMKKASTRSSKYEQIKRAHNRTFVRFYAYGRLSIGADIGTLRRDAPGRNNYSDDRVGVCAV